MHWKNYFNCIKVSFLVLLVFNLTYIALGYSTVVFFSKGISALFSVVGIITFFVPIIAYSYVTWNIINKHRGDAINSAVASVLLSLLLFAASELGGFIMTSLIFLNIMPENVISTALRAQFAEQFFNISNVILGLALGLVIAFIGGFFGFITSEIQKNFIPKMKSILQGKGSIQKKSKLLILLVLDTIIFAISTLKSALIKLGTSIKQTAHSIHVKMHQFHLGRAHRNIGSAKMQRVNISEKLKNHQLQLLQQQNLILHNALYSFIGHYTSP